MAQVGAMIILETGKSRQINLLSRHRLGSLPQPGLCGRCGNNPRPWSKRLRSRMGLFQGSAKVDGRLVAKRDGVVLRTQSA